MFEKYISLPLYKQKLLISSIDNYSEALINDYFISVIWILKRVDKTDYLNKPRATLEKKKKTSLIKSPEILAN